MYAECGLTVRAWRDTVWMLLQQFFDSAKTMERDSARVISRWKAPSGAGVRLGCRFPGVHLLHASGGETVSTGSCKSRLRVEEFGDLVNTAGKPYKCQQQQALRSRCLIESRPDPMLPGARVWACLDLDNPEA